MENSRRIALLAALLLSVTMGAAGHARAADCCPGSGCCGTGQTYAGQQLFPNPAAPFQVNAAPVPNRPQPAQVTNVTVGADKSRSAQSRIKPIVPVALQASARLPEARGMSFSSFFGTLW